MSEVLQRRRRGDEGQNARRPALPLQPDGCCTTSGTSATSFGPSEVATGWPAAPRSKAPPALARRPPSRSLGGRTGGTGPMLKSEGATTAIVPRRFAPTSSSSLRLTARPRFRARIILAPSPLAAARRSLWPARRRGSLERERPASPWDLPGASRRAAGRGRRGTARRTPS